jgi:lipopolysaccharide biosynthesis glycosyltransferase
MKTVIATMTDSAHFGWAIQSLKSLRLTNSSIPVYIVLIGGKKEQAKKVRKINPRAYCEIYVGAYRKCSHHSLSQFKPRAIRGALKKFSMKNGDNIIWADADCIYTYSIGEILTILERHDLTIKVQKRAANRFVRAQYIKRIFNAGIIGVRLNPIMRSFLSAWSKRVYVGVRSKQWCAKQHDQGRLFLTYEKYKDRIKFAQLPHSFNTPYIREGQTIPKIWHMMAMKKYPDRANYIIKKVFECIRKGERKFT